MTQSINKQTTRSLKDFKISLKTFNLFTSISSNLPPFLNDNLVDDARSIKIFKKDIKAFIKIFSFQFFKLCFQSESIDYQTKINKFINLLQTHSHYLKPIQKSTKQPLSILNIKNIILQLLQLMSQCQQLVQITLTKYPQICQIINNFFSNYLTQQHNIPPNQYNTNKSIKILSDLLQVDIVQYDNCIQYTDTQVYSYKQSQDQIYLIYIDQTKAMRNTKIQPTQTLNDSAFIKCSTKTIEPQKRQIIAFDQPDIVFNNSIFSNDSQNIVKIQQDIQNDNQFIKKGQELKTMITKEKQVKINGQINKINTHQVQYNKQNYSPKANGNISKQFTDTFILDNILDEPYRTKIKQIKNLARKQRKARQLFFT